MTFNPRYTDPSRFNNRHEYEAYQNHADTELSHAIREILNFKVTDQRVHKYITQDYMPVSYAVSPTDVVDSKVVYETETLWSIEASDRDLLRVIRQIKELEKTTRRLNDAKGQLQIIREQSYKLREFMSDNPAIKDSYDELMVMCKLHGLDVPLV